MSDKDLLARMANGHRDALAVLYDRYCAVLVGVGIRLLGDREAAEDLVHDVLLESWRQAADYAPERGSVRTWLLVRLRSRALDRLRAPASSRTVLLGETLPPTATPEPTADGTDLSRVRGALGTLSPDQRAVLDLAYFEGLSSSEIATRLGIPVGTVKSRTAAALANLRGLLAMKAA